MRNLRSGHVFAIALAILTWSAAAEDINWFCLPGGTNLTSEGLPMDGTFQFQLGVFSGGFVPTSVNMNQWVANWVVQSSAPYNAGFQSFDKTITLPSNAAPFSIGAAAYVWGRSTAAGKDEWILFRKATWTWPNASAFPPGFREWDAATADLVVLGSINPTGSPHLMKSVAIQSYTQWVTASLSGEPMNSPNDDPDNDGTNNLLEFVFGTSPLVSNAPTPTPVELVDISGLKYAQIRIPRLAEHFATLTVEVSGDLMTWSSGAGSTATVENSTAALVVRDLTHTGASGGKRFMCLKASLP